MDRKMFVEITRKAHQLTRAYKRKYQVSYVAQWKIFFKLLFGMWKKNDKIEKATKVKQKIKGILCNVTYFIKGKGLDLHYTTEVNGKIDPNFKDLWTCLAGKVSNVVPLII